MDFRLLQAFGTALFIGALVGTERTQHRQGEPAGFAGLRTFILFAELGALLAFLSGQLKSLVPFSLGLVCVTLVVTAAYAVQRWTRETDIGMTTEVTAIVVYVLGGLALMDQAVLAVALAIVTAALLATKKALHEGIARISHVELMAALRLLFASFIVLPILPRRAIDPWNALSPYKLWLIVVLISALSMVGYVTVRVLGAARGVIVTGFFGGIVSSTAATLTFARQSRETDISSHAISGGILISWTVMFLRVLGLIAVLRWSLVSRVAIPLLLMSLLGFLLCGLAMTRTRRVLGHKAVLAREATFTNPFSLVSAIKFASVFASVLLATKLVNRYAPGAGIYWLSAIAGSTDVDALVLSLVELGKNDGAINLMLARGTLIAAVANTVMKFVLALSLGTRTLAKDLSISTALLVSTGLVSVFFIR
jgi:uncharacterized membrane protein (DUF4010 family)